MKPISLSLILMLASGGDMWSINVTRRVRVRRGSDVIIPCTFTVPPLSTGVQLFWKNHDKSPVKSPDRDLNGFVFHPTKSFEVAKYRGKTSLPGHEADGNNCSLKILGVTDSDPSIYLRVVTKQNSYSFWKDSVSISIGEQGDDPVAIEPDISATAQAPHVESTEAMHTSAHVYVSILVPLFAILILSSAVGFLVYVKRRSLLNLRAQESLPYNSGKEANQDFKNELPAAKNLEEPIYVNYSNQETHAGPGAKDPDNIYANVDYTSAGF